MMKLGEFSSVVQLGVGLHAGTVLLQAIVEFASAPLSHRIDRLARIARLKLERFQRDKRDASEIAATQSGILDTQSALELKKVQFFTEYKFAAAINTVAAIALFIILVWAAASADRDVSVWLAMGISFLSAGPAVTSLLVLWWRWNSNTASIRDSIRQLEGQLFAIK